MEAAAHGSETPRIPTSARHALVDEGPTPINTAFKAIMEVKSQCICNKTNDPTPLAGGV